MLVPRRRRRWLRWHDRPRAPPEKSNPSTPAAWGPAPAMMVSARPTMNPFSPAGPVTRLSSNLRLTQHQQAAMVNYRHIGLPAPAGTSPATGEDHPQQVRQGIGGPPRTRSGARLSRRTAGRSRGRRWLPGEPDHRDQHPTWNASVLAPLAGLTDQLRRCVPAQYGPPCRDHRPLGIVLVASDSIPVTFGSASRGRSRRAWTQGRRWKVNGRGRFLCDALSSDRTH